MSYHTLGLSGELYEPTVHEHQPFNPDEDAELLRNAMHGAGTDEKTLIKILCHRTSHQRMKIAQVYKTMFGKDLKASLESETSGNFRHCLKLMMMENSYLKAYICYKAIKGAGTDEQALIEVLCSASNSEMKEIKEKYMEVLQHEGKNNGKRNLEKDVIEDTSGFFQRVLVALIQADRKEPTVEQLYSVPQTGIDTIIDREMAERQAAKLYNAGEGKLGTDEAAFISILARESVWQLAAIDLAYKQMSKKSLRDAVKSEMSGDLKKAMTALLDFSLDKPSTFSKLLYKSMKGLGTNDCCLARIVVSRSEIDMAEIKKAYLRDYGVTLAEDIKGDTSGDYKHTLLALIGEE